MTRRRFIERLLKAVSAVIVGAWWLLKEKIPRRFVWAAKVKKYPGRVWSFVKVSKRSKWSG